MSILSLLHYFRSDEHADPTVLRLMRTGVLLSSLLAAPAGAHAASATTTLKFWVIDDGLVSPLVSSYHAGHPAVQVQVTYVPAERFVSRFRAAVSAGTGPDLVDIDLINTPNFAAAGLLADITAQARRLPYFRRLSPAPMRLATYHGKIFALPLVGNSSVLVYNKALFRKAGLNPNRAPATWFAIEQDARKITALGRGYYGYSFVGDSAPFIAYTFLPLIWASGGDVLDADGTHATLTASPQVRAALAFYRRLWLDGLVPPGAQTDSTGSLQNSDFESGTIGMSILGDPLVVALEQQQNPAIDIGVGYIPGQNGGRSAFAGGENVAIVRGSPHAAAAWDFVNWCLAYDQQEAIVQQGGDPVRSDLLNNTDFNGDARRLLAAQAVFQGRAPFAVPYFALFNDQAGPLLALFKQAVFDGRIDTAIATAQQRFIQILQQS